MAFIVKNGERVHGIYPTEALALGEVERGQVDEGGEKLALTHVEVADLPAHVIPGAKISAENVVELKQPVADDHAERKYLREISANYVFFQEQIKDWWADELTLDTEERADAVAAIGATRRWRFHAAVGLANFVRGDVDGVELTAVEKAALIQHDRTSTDVYKFYRLVQKDKSIRNTWKLAPHAAGEAVSMDGAYADGMPRISDGGYQPVGGTIPEGFDPNTLGGE